MGECLADLPYANLGRHFPGRHPQTDTLRQTPTRQTPPRQTPPLSRHPSWAADNPPPWQIYLQRWPLQRMVRIPLECTPLKNEYTIHYLTIQPTETFTKIASVNAPTYNSTTHLENSLCNSPRLKNDSCK